MSETKYLDASSLELLKLYSCRDSLSLKDLAAIHNKDLTDFIPTVNYLRHNELLEIHPNFTILHGSTLTADAPLRITYEGRVKLEAEQKNRRSNNLKEFRAWVTLTIALIALIVSIISLVISRQFL